MAKIERQQAIKRIIDGLRLDTGREVVPNQVHPVMVGTFEVGNPLHTNTVRSGNSAATGTITIFTSSSIKKFYLQGFVISYEKNAACDNTSIELVCTPLGDSARTIADIRTITLTASREFIQVDLSTPLLLQPNTTITLTGAFTVGALTRGVTIRGYEDDD